MKPQNKLKSKKKLSGDEFAALVSSGESLAGHVDWDKAVKIVNVSRPVWMVKGLDKEAQRLNIDRQAVIKTWLAKRLDQKDSRKKEAV